MKIVFITTGDINNIATMKRATGMSMPLIALGNEVYIVALNCKNNIERFRLECPDANILFYNNMNFFSEIYSKNRLLSRLNPDIVYVCAMVNRNFILKSLFCPKAKLLVEHSELVSSIPNLKLYKRISSLFLEKYSYLFFDGQIVASRFLEAFYKKKASNKRRKYIFYSPYAYSSLIMLNEPTIEPLGEKYKGKKIILYMGTLRLNYGFAHIIRAMKKITTQNVVLLVMGDGLHRKYGEELVSKLGLNDKVKFLGFVKEEMLSSYFKIADTFVSPIFNTIQDKARCPSKLFMYLPFNKPIVTSNIGEAKELFGKNYPFYYDSSNENDMSEILDKSFQPFKNTYWVSENHEWNKRTNDLYNWIISTYKKD